jgi:hypothetical protein
MRFFTIVWSPLKIENYLDLYPRCLLTPSLEKSLMYNRALRLIFCERKTQIRYCFYYDYFFSLFYKSCTLLEVHSAFIVTV